ncbi:MAG: hypothetical protein GY820_46715 [Gammaproteobacteria bacterium]|nr:hypothetical protein [Gammaproteobacteria bacterium]
MKDINDIFNIALKYADLIREDNDKTIKIKAELITLLSTKDGREQILKKAREIYPYDSNSFKKNSDSQIDEIITRKLFRAARKITGATFAYTLEFFHQVEGIV